MMEPAIRILIADDHAIVREGLAAVLASQSDLCLAGEAANGAEAVAEARRLQPDLILMDLRMPGMSGLEALREIRQQDAAARVLILTSFDADDEVVAAIEAGAAGYLLKETPTPELLAAIRAVVRGEVPLHPSLVRKLVLKLNRPAAPAEEPLTARELDVVKLVARGCSNQAIAAALNLSPATVHYHLSHILNKLRLENRTQVALYGLRKKLVTLDE